MAREEEKLKLGKGAAFVKSRFKRLRQEDETWEADFRALPKPITQSETHYLGLVVTEPDGFLLAESHVEGRPSVNDLATLLARLLISGDELRELKRHTGAMAEAFGLDRKIESYKGTRPLTLWQKDADFGDF